MKGNSNISLKLKIGYGVASLGDTAIYNLLLIYSLYFLTDVAKISPLFSGMIIFIATIWNAIFIGIIGYLSDKTSSKKNRRLPFMEKAIIPIIIFTILVFTTVSGPIWLKTIYYMFVNACVWTAHSMYVVPYEALGAEITNNSCERTVLRSYARFFMAIGNIFGMVIVLKLVELLEGLGQSNQMAWQWTSFIIAIIAGFSCYMTVHLIRQSLGRIDNSLQREEQDRQSLKALVREYYQVILLKPFKYLLAVTLCFTAANIFFSSDVLYFMKYNLDLPEKDKSIVFLVLTLCGLFLTPIYSGLCKKFDKKIVMMWAFIVSGMGMYAFAFIGITSFIILAAYITIFTIGSSAYWQLMYSVVYDISEYDEWEHSKRREGIIMSSSKIFLRISTAISIQLLAVVLNFFSYNAELKAQCARTLNGIEISLTYLPATFYIAAAICIYFYPLSNEKHEEIMQYLNIRKKVKNDAENQ